jgi:hypothetical protein
MFFLMVVSLELVPMFFGSKLASLLSGIFQDKSLPSEHQ